MSIHQLVGLFSAFLVVCTTVACSNSRATLTQESDERALQGAGATFPAPLYRKWIEEYRNIKPEVAIRYEPVGSGEGVERFIAGSVDFAASDAAMSDEEISKVDAGVQLIPMCAGSIVIAYNLPNVGTPLRLSRSTYTGIFLGEITKWNDAQIRADNPNSELPSLSIAIAARRDSSGTTFAFTNHLSAVSSQWRDRGAGIGKVIDWPGSAMLAAGNEGVSGLIKRSPGTIGYVEFGVASRAGLSMATLENKAGNFVEPSGDAGFATLNESTLPENLRGFFPDPAGEKSYPIVTYSWLMLYRHYDDASKREQLKGFVRWCLNEGQPFNESLGYIPLVPKVANLATTALDRVE